MLRLSWALALAFTVAVLVGILIVTRDLSITSDTFKRGVAEAEILETTTDDALAGAAQLPPASQSLRDGLPDVVAVTNSMAAAEESLGALGNQLRALGTALSTADVPLGATIGSIQTATEQTNGATTPAGNIAHTLGEAESKAQSLSALLDQTLVLGQTIDTKLRIAFLLPKFGN